MSTKISQGTDQVNENKSVMVGDRASSPLNALASELSGRELDARVGSTVMELCVVGVTTCTHIEGGWDVSVTWSEDSYWASQEPVYVPLDHPVGCERCAEPESDVYGKFAGYSDACLRVVPFYSADLNAATEVLEKVSYEYQISRSRLESHTLRPYRVIAFSPKGGKGFGVTMAEAVCLAALNVVENNSDTKTVSASLESGKG